ncbi:type II toxin-antitoxin system Phd/YefM family antitoxin [Iamia sp.]|uniref:type II toxin-antitoxin system Phd/YefM family antitoxin n=1 Tax=Iamia sp. TaxID=2722710 RepID=UPI002D105E47|nr:type II toxin-antitoxin system Phd/YefM family antitoxin [Iamia sp.]HXH56980.1 type II toxin-antitoxin system Phd/YefM family antitoxin [Iamia sp.]
MTTVNIHEAKTHLSRLVARVEAGEEITIARAGRPVARLVAPETPKEPRKLGLWKGKVWVADDFDETPEWLIGEFEDGPIEPPGLG